MKKFRILFLSLASSIGAVAAEIDVTPGQLTSQWGDGGKGQKELKLTGSIDARDLAAFENLSQDVQLLDLSEVTIQALTMPDKKYFGRTLFKEGEIPPYTFFKSQVTSLILPAHVKLIGEGAFAGSSISKITIPEGVTSLGDYAFYGCQNLTEVSLPASLGSIGKGAFGNCISLQSINFAQTGLETVPDRTFAGAVQLAEIILPSDIKKIGREAFSHTSIRTLTLNNVQEFEAYALSGMPFLEELSLNPEATINDGLLMDNISLASLTGMPEFVPDYFAANCENLPTESLIQASSLGKYSFANTKAPKELVLSAYISRIDRGALSGLNFIERIDATSLEGNIPSVDEHSFEGLQQQNIKLYVSADSYDFWVQAPYWNQFYIVKEGETGVDEIPDSNGESTLLIGLKNGSVVIESAVAITDIRIYTADGRVAFIASPIEERFEIDSSALPYGIIVVAASDSDGNSTTTSLLLK